VFDLGSEIMDFSGKMTSIGEGNCKTVRIGMRERERGRERERVLSAVQKNKGNS
jgi:hypothetical protein